MGVGLVILDLARIKVNFQLPVWVVTEPTPAPTRRGSTQQLLHAALPAGGT